MSDDRLPFEPQFFEAPADALGPPVREKVILEDRTFLIERPTDPDLLLNHPAIHDAFDRDEHMPYWAELWPGARMMGKALLRESWPENQTALEVGCGLGLAGVVALSVGLHVIFSDYNLTALQFAEMNARANGYSNFELMPLDWRFPPEDLQVPLILASDVIYESRNIDPLLKLIHTILAPEGLCLLSDQNRAPAELFREALTREGFHYTSQMMRAGEPGGPRVKGALYRIQKAKS